MLTFFQKKELIITFSTQKSPYFWIIMKYIFIVETVQVVRVNELYKDDMYNITINLAGSTNKTSYYLK